MRWVFSRSNSILFNLLELWAKATACVLVLPIIFFICVPFSILLIPPLFIASIWAFFLYQILCFLSPDRVVETMRLFESCTQLIFGRTACVADRQDGNRNMMKELVSKSLEDKQHAAVSVVEFDPSDVPDFYESDDHDPENCYQEVKENVNEENGKNTGMYKEPGSWKFVVPKPALANRKKDKHSFHEVLSYWRSKEKGEAASDDKEEECSV